MTNPAHSQATSESPVLLSFSSPGHSRRSGLKRQVRSILSLLAKIIVNNAIEKAQPICPCTACQQAPARVEKLQRSSRRSAGTKRIFLLLSAWVLLGYLVYSLATAPKIQGGTVYNPFEILGLSSSATEKQIKKHYKKLSLQLYVFPHVSLQ